MDVTMRTEQPSSSRMRSSTLLSAVLLLGSLAFLVTTGVSLKTSVGIAVVVGVQSVGGCLVWNRLRPGCDALESIGMGIALGTGMAVLSGLVMKVFFDVSWGWLLPTTVALLMVSVTRIRGTRVRQQERDPGLDRSKLVALLVAAVVGGVSLLGNIRHYPLSWQGSWSGYHTDMPFFEALATSLAKLGPLDSIFLPGAEVRYHWLVYAWSGQVSQAVGAEGFVMLTRGLQLVAVLASSLLVISWTRTLTHRLFTPTLAVLLLLAGGYVGVTYGGILNFDSPSQSLGVVWLLGAAIALLTFVSSAPASPRIQGIWLAVIVVFGFITTGGKVSAAAPALVGAALMAGVGIVTRASWSRRAIQGSAALVVGSLLAYVLILSGANGGGGLEFGSLIDRTSSQQGINPMQGGIGVVLGTGILVLSVLLRWSGLFWLASNRVSRHRPDVIFALGLAIAGVMAIVVFNGFNEIWFAAAASAPIAVFTAEGFESALDTLRRNGSRLSIRAIVIVSVIAAAAIFAIVWAIWATGPAGGSYWRGTWRWTGPIAALFLAALAGWLITRISTGRSSRVDILAGLTIVLVLVATPSRLLGIGTGLVGQPAGLRPDLFSMGIAPTVRGHDEKLISDIPWEVMEAGQWLRGHAAESDLLATNLTFGPLIPAITGLQTFASGVQYQAPYGRPSTAVELIARDDQIWTFVNSPSTTTLAPLCDAGVNWIWVDPSETDIRSWAPYASVAYSNPAATILRLTPEACP